MTERYVVSSLGPIDRLRPGEDVTERYGAAVLARLVEEGYVIPERLARLAEVDPAEVEETPDGGESAVHPISD